MNQKNNNEYQPRPTPELIRVTFELVRKQKPSLHLALRNIYFQLIASSSHREIQTCLNQVTPYLDGIITQLERYQLKHKGQHEDWVKELLLNVIVNKWIEMRATATRSLAMVANKRAYN